MATDTALNSRNAFVYISGRLPAAIAAKILRNPGGRCTSVLAGTPKKQACGTAFDPSQLHERDATEPHIRLNVYHADALPREPIRIIRGQPEQTVAWPKHGDAS